MGRDLSNLNIKDSYQGLVQISGSELTDGTGSLIESLEVSSSYATTASFALTTAQEFDTGSLLVTASISDDTITFTKGDDSTFDIAVNNVENANTASYVAGANVDGTVASATTATTADTASYVAGANVDGQVSSAATADSATTANTASYVAGANVDGEVASAATATSASYALTASFAENVTIPTLQSVTDEGASTTNDLTLANVSASGYVSASSFIGDGSQLTGLTAEAFPYTGSAEIYGQLYITDTSASVSSSNVIIGSGSVIDTTTTATDFTQLGSNGIYSAVNSTITYPTSVNRFHGSGILFGIRNQIDYGPNVSTSPFDDNAGLVIIGGRDNILRSYRFTGAYGRGGQTIVGGDGNLISGNSFEGGQAIIGGNGNKIGSPSTSGESIGDNGVIIGGSNNELRGGSHDETFIVGGVNHDLYGNRYGGIVGGIFNRFLNVTNFSEQANVIVGGGSNTMDGASAGDLSHNVILGGRSNVFGVSGDTDTSISSSAIVGGNFNRVRHDRSVVLGGINHVTTKADEVVATHLNLSGSAISGVHGLVITSATASLDCVQGNYFELTLDDGIDTRLEATNIQAGQSINIKITQAPLTAGTLSFGPEFEFENGAAFTPSTGVGEVDVISAISFDGASLQTSGLNNFQ